MATAQLKLGSYTFPNSFYISESGNAARSTSTERAGASGAVVVARFTQSRQITIQGVLMARNLLTNTTIDLRTAIDALRAALVSGPTTLYTNPDRYLRNVTFEDSPESFDATGNERIATIRIRLRASDPIFFDTTTQAGGGVLTASAQTKSVTVGGNAPAQPQLAVTIGAGTSANITITNQATGEVATLKGTVAAGDVYTIDALAQTVTKSGVDAMALFDGLFPTLIPGTNILRVDYVGATVTNLGITWQNRFW